MPGHPLDELIDDILAGRSSMNKDALVDALAADGGAAIGARVTMFHPHE